MFTLTSLPSVTCQNAPYCPQQFCSLPSKFDAPVPASVLQLLLSPGSRAKDTANVRVQINAYTCYISPRMGQICCDTVFLADDSHFCLAKRCYIVPSAFFWISPPLSSLRPFPP